jgi:hypothetical protein
MADFRSHASLFATKFAPTFASSFGSQGNLRVKVVEPPTGLAREWAIQGSNL